MNSLDCAGFFVLGLIIGGLLIDVRYRYRALVAGRLAGQEESQVDRWLSDETRQIVTIVALITSVILVVVVTIATISYVNDSWYIKNGYVYVKIPGQEGRAYWEYRGSVPAPLKENPGSAAEKEK